MSDSLMVYQLRQLTEAFLGANRLPQLLEVLPPLLITDVLVSLVELNQGDLALAALTRADPEASLSVAIAAVEAGDLAVAARLAELAASRSAGRDFGALLRVATAYHAQGKTALGLELLNGGVALLQEK